jgi:hypothetical protein
MLVQECNESNLDCFLDASTTLSGQNNHRDESGSQLLGETEGMFLFESAPRRRVTRFHFPISSKMMLQSPSQWSSVF